MNLSEKVAIIGSGEASREKNPGRRAIHLAIEAANKAIKNAGIDKSKIDGILTGYSLVEPEMDFSSRLSQELGITPNFSSTISVSGATGCALVEHAALAIAAGFCNYILVAWADNRASGTMRGNFVSKLAENGNEQFEVPYGPLIPTQYALAAQRHIHEFGTTPEQLASVAVTFREHALKNPDAQMKKPISIQDVLNSKMISSPLHLLDCCIVTDFGGALLLTSKERASDSKNTPIYILGIGEGHTHENIMNSRNLMYTGAINSGKTAFSMAGITHQDIDLVQLYDCFTITVLLELEDLGFCEKGEAGTLVEKGYLSLGGKLPANTNGGMLSCANGGILHVTEAVTQLRNEGKERQVPNNPRIALVHGNGGILSSHCTLILGR
ncbi:thiolase [Neobacillus sp. 114]|uniref:thiolase C-terminal domain-containing protein n=1 Tax=Neobacillus sp. 114 TaxID=3048535 RepID=UPI0024C37D69|nr:thiolase [Neobacillus sp. 114]